MQVTRTSRVRNMAVTSLSCQCVLSFLLLILLLTTQLHIASSDDLELPVDKQYDYLVKAVRECDGSDQLPVQWLDASVRRTGRTTVGIHAALEQGIEVPDSPAYTLHLQVYKQDGEDVNTRSLRAEYVMLDVCNRMKDKSNEVMEAFIKSVEGGMTGECPIKAGHYKITNFEVKLKDIQFVLTEGRMILNATQVLNSKVICCTLIDMDVIPHEE